MAITEAKFIANNQPFLSIMTRCYKRPNALAVNMAALAKQTDQDFEQVFLVDETGMGLLYANGQFFRHRNRAKGRYVLMLDDDDMLTDPKAIEKLRLATQSNPDAVFFQFNCGEFGILPDDAHWQEKPISGFIGTSCFITRLDLWQSYIWSFEAPKAGDFQFISTVWPHLTNIVWLKEVLGTVQRNGHGRSE